MHGISHHRITLFFLTELSNMRAVQASRMYHIHFTLRIWKRTGGVYLTVFCSGILSPLGNQIYGTRIKMCGVRLEIVRMR